LREFIEAYADLPVRAEGRAEVANIRAEIADTPDSLSYNANIAAANITQTPHLAHFAPLVVGRDAVPPNRVLAMMQLIPGVYAGPQELIQWCRLRNTKAIVVDQDDSVMMYMARIGRGSRTYSSRLPRRSRRAHSSAAEKEKGSMAFAVGP
jgi:hypothetical protein